MTSNIFLGREIKRRWLGGAVRFLNKPAMERRSTEIMKELGIGVKSVRAKVENLSGGQRQAVAIGRAVGFNAKVIIMDEPTASLSVKSIAPLLDLIQCLKGQGRALVLISHRLQDIFTVGDRVMVLKGGECVGVRSVRDTHMDEVVELMVKGFCGPSAGALGLSQAYSDLRPGEEGQ